MHIAKELPGFFGVSIIPEQRTKTASTMARTCLIEVQESVISACLSLNDRIVQESRNVFGYDETCFSVCICEHCRLFWRKIHKTDPKPEKSSRIMKIQFQTLWYKLRATFTPRQADDDYEKSVYARAPTTCIALVAVKMSTQHNRARGSHTHSI